MGQFASVLRSCTTSSVPSNLIGVKDAFLQEIVDLWNDQNKRGKIYTYYLYTIPVGTLMVEENGEDWTIRGTWVAEEYRKEGIGRRMLEDLKSKFDSSKIASRLWVNITPQAEGFYKKLGFRIPGYRVDTPAPMSVGIFVKGAYLDTIFSEKYKGFVYAEE